MGAGSCIEPSPSQVKGPNVWKRLFWMLDLEGVLEGDIKTIY